MTRVIELPERGVLVVGTDLHGNLADFRVLVARFGDLRDRGTDAPLGLAGALLPGPATPAAEWPEHPGPFYRDETPQLLAEARALQDSFPTRVHYLLGNHEHAHLGGPRLEKFHPDEAAHLEDRYPA